MKRSSRQPILLVTVTGIGVAVSWIAAFSALVTIALFIYLALDLICHGCSWQSVGIKRHGHWADLKNTWPLVVVVSVVGPFALILGSRLWLPALYIRLVERTEFLTYQLGFYAPPVLFLGIMAIGTVIEEVVYRAFLQERLSLCLNPYLSVIVAAMLFGYSHWGAPPDTLVVMFADVVHIVFDGVVFGLIYLRSRNLLLTWVTHYLGNLVSLTLLLLL